MEGGGLDGSGVARPCPPPSREEGGLLPGVADERGDGRYGRGRVRGSRGGGGGAGGDGGFYLSSSPPFVNV